MDQWYKTYAKYKWEFLRRNPDYQTDFDKLTEPPFQNVESNLDRFYWQLYAENKEEAKAFQLKWGLGYPINYRHSFEELPDFGVQFDIYWSARGDRTIIGEHRYPVDVMGKDDSLRDWMLTEELYNLPRDEKYWNILIKREYIRDNKLLFNVDLRWDKEIILDHIEEILEFFMQVRSSIIDEKPPTRERHHFDKYDNYLKVWDLRQKGLSFPDIAREIFPDDFKDPSELEEGDPEPNPDSALVKVQQYYEKADRLIRSSI